MSISAIQRYRIPSGPLAEFVELLWLHDGDPQAHAQERLLPTPTTEMVVDLRGSMKNSQTAIIVGPYSEHWVLETSAAAAVVGVHFRPGGAFPFFGVPAGELHNSRVSLDTLWGSRAALLEEQVLAAPTPDEKFDVLERMLLGVAGELKRHRAVAFALRELSSPRHLTIVEVADAVGMSQRRFLDRFRNEVGMAPKLFSRVQRFQAIVETVHTLRQVNWADIAVECGYFDQAHFTHDFRSFSGFAPETYLALKIQQRNHVPLPQ